MTVRCDKCTLFACYNPQELEKTSKLDFCPMNVCKDALDEAREEYKNPDVGKVALASSWVEATGYMKWTRVEETIEFARKMKFRKLGIACCIGLKKEGKILVDILKANGFEVVFTFCKAGAIVKEELGLKREEKIHPEKFEAMCNPIGQAKILNREETELNVVVGLCVGHDSLFMKYSKALVTVLVAKDRPLCHNPVGALNTAEGYYESKLYEEHRVTAK